MSEKVYLFCIIGVIVQKLFCVHPSLFQWLSQMSRPMGKPTICIGENKGADQLRGNREADQRLCFRLSDCTIPLLLKNLKFQASSCFLCLYRPVCVGPVRRPHCWFSHEAAQMLECVGTDLPLFISPCYHHASLKLSVQK